VNWADFLANTTVSPPTTNPAGCILNPGKQKPAMDWDTVGPAFHNADVVKNEHELNPSRIPNALQMMIHLRLFIPLSMLTMVSVTQIWYNENLKFKNIPFGYAVGKYALDEALFPPEDSLTDAEFMQAHKHWLTLFKILAEPSIYNGLKSHHDRMCDDPDLLKWAHSW